MLVLVRHQWARNERVPFPLAEAYVALIEAPEDGRLTNALFASRLFWLAAGAVFFIHLNNGLAQYFPHNVPVIPLSYNLGNILNNDIWQYADWRLKYSAVYFCVVGMSYFVSTRIALSLWAFYLIRQAMQMFLGRYGTQMPSSAASDQVLGAMLAIAGLVVWTGRRHWADILRSMAGQGKPSSHNHDTPLYAMAGWGLLLCGLTALAWFMAVGMSFASAAVLTSLLLVMFLVMARVVAETGLVFATIGVPLGRLWFAGAELGLPAVTGRTNFLNTWMSTLTVPALRESVAVYASNAMQICHPDDKAAPQRWGTGRLVLAFGLVLAVSYIVSGASTLLVEYNHAVTLDRKASSPINPSAVLTEPANILASANSVALGRSSAVKHIAIGSGVTLVLGTLSLRFAWWPLAPVGYLLWQSWPLAAVWFSIFLGWLTKVLILKYGGSSLFRAARPFFLGLVIGEVAAAGFWIMVSLVAAWNGAGYVPLNLLPG
jgi:hypothetical protein